jgi:hypothetical protein
MKLPTYKTIELIGEIYLRATQSEGRRAPRGIVKLRRGRRYYPAPRLAFMAITTLLNELDRRRVGNGQYRIKAEAKKEIPRVRDYIARRRPM